LLALNNLITANNPQITVCLSKLVPREYRMGN